MKFAHRLGAAQVSARGRSGTALLVPLAAVLAGFVLSRPATAGQFGLSAQGSVTHHEGDDRGFEIDDMNRGDNPFSPVRMVLMVRGEVDPKTDLFLEVPIDMTSNSSLFLTYFRPFLRVRELAGTTWLNVQAGKIPTVFGTYGERTNSTENALMGVPLLYFYHTAARGDLVPAGPDYFFSPGVRGEGYEAVPLGGGGTSFVGSPLVYDACWDTGVELFGGRSGVQYSLATTHGTVSRPAMFDNYNDGYGVVGRVGYEVPSGPLFGLRVGGTAAAGPYLNKSVEDDPNFPAGKSAEDYLNTAFGADFAFARGEWQFFAEAARIGYEVPNVTTTLHADAYYVEAARDFGPRWSLGFRQEAVVFGKIRGSGGNEDRWDYNLARWETVINYRFRPGARVRLGWQATRYPNASSLDSDMVALQLQVWTR